MSIGEQGEPHTVRDFRDFWIYMGALERGRSNTIIALIYPLTHYLSVYELIDRVPHSHIQISLIYIFMNR